MNTRAVKMGQVLRDRRGPAWWRWLKSTMQA